MHYQFASELFNGYVKQIVPEGCAIEIQALDGEPFFNYALDFLSRFKYSNDLRPFKNDYKKLMLRTFEFDVTYHKILIQAAISSTDIDQNKTISDFEIFEATGTDVEDLRQFVINNEVPFNIITYLSIIREIHIETSALKNKLENYKPSTFENINRKGVLDLLQQKENSDLEKEKFLKKAIIDSGLHIGDYILVEERYSSGAKIGLIKGLSLNYNGRLEISYNLLKKDFKESKLNLQTTMLENISYILQDSQLDIISKMSIIPKESQIKLLKKESRKNSHYRIKEH